MKSRLWGLFVFLILMMSLVGCNITQSDVKDSLKQEVVKYELEDLDGYWVNADKGDYLFINQKVEGNGEMTIYDSDHDLIYLYEIEQPKNNIFKLLVTDEMTGTEIIDEPFEIILRFGELDTLIKKVNGNRQKYIRITAVAFEEYMQEEDRAEDKSIEKEDKVLEEKRNAATSVEPSIEEALVSKASGYFDSTGEDSSFLKLYPAEWTHLDNEDYYDMPFSDGDRVTSIYGDSDGEIYMDVMGDELERVDVEYPFSDPNPGLPLDIWVLSLDFKVSLEKGIMPGSAVQLGNTLEEMETQLGSLHEVNEFEGANYYFYDYHSFQIELTENGVEEVLAIGWGYSERLHVEVGILIDTWGQPDRIEESSYHGVPSNNYIYDLNDTYLFEVTTTGTDDESAIINVSYSRK